MRRRLAWGRRNRLPTVGASPRARPGRRRPVWGALRLAATPGRAGASAARLWNSTFCALTNLRRCAIISICAKAHDPWGCSSAGRASRSQRGGRGFESHHLHHGNSDGAGSHDPAPLFMRAILRGATRSARAGWRGRLPGAGSLARGRGRAPGFERTRLRAVTSRRRRTARILLGAGGGRCSLGPVAGIERPALGAPPTAAVDGGTGRAARAAAGLRSGQADRLRRVCVGLAAPSRAPRAIGRGAACAPQLAKIDDLTTTAVRFRPAFCLRGHAVRRRPG